MKNQSNLRWWQVVCSVAAAFFGVQSNEARQRDFESNSPWLFIIIGILLTLVLVMALIGVVWLVT